MNDRAITSTKDTVLSSPRLPIRDAELRDRLRSASPQGRILYHRGFLALDRDPARTRLPERSRAELVRVAWRAFEAWSDGTADLVQKRHGFSDFSYFLIVRRGSIAGKEPASTGGGAR
jgi:hypothetical protein